MQNSPTTETYRLVIARDFAAPRDLVWRAWTEPSQVKQWLSLGDETTIESITMDLRIGGKFRIQTKAEDGEYFTAAGSYVDVQPLERLIYSWDWEKDGAGSEFGELEGQETQVTVELQEQGGKTRLILTHEKFVSVQKRDRHEQGWQAWIDRLAKFLQA